ncbi:MAG: GDP-mannose 4,6-dehydratase [Elusimicrobia bacterium]|nr:GDP-mannose 4,6-dehydratase [Elusimicrobiota bacterium]
MNVGFTTSLKGQNILVTGASGFIGSHLISFLSSQDAKVHALIFSREVPTQNLWKFKTKSIKYYKCSFLNFRKLNSIVKFIKPVKIIHLGSLVDLNRSFQIARQVIHANIKGTLNLLESLRNVPFDLFVYASSVEVYGNGPIPFKESQREIPPSPYAISKLTGEHFVNFYSKIYNYPISILRLSTCYGPGQNENRLIPSAIKSALASRSIEISQINQSRNFIYIRDIIKAIGKVLVKPKVINEIINIGSEETISVEKMIESIKILTGSNSRTLAGRVPNRAQEIQNWSVSSVKAKKILGWKVSTSLRQGLKETIAWYQR